MNSGYLLNCSYPSKYKTKRGRHVRLFSDPPPRTLPTLMIQVEHYYYFSSLCMRMRERMRYVRECVEVLFITQRGRFPPELDMETLGTAFKRIRRIFPPKCTWTGFRDGSAKPVVRPAPGRRLSRRLLSWTLPGGPPSCVCQCRGFVRRFSMSNGPILQV